jgi:hypothetical protein
MITGNNSPGLSLLEYGEAREALTAIDAFLDEGRR